MACTCHFKESWAPSRALPARQWNERTCSAKLPPRAPLGTHGSDACRSGLQLKDPLSYNKKSEDILLLHSSALGYFPFFKIKIKLCFQLCDFVVYWLSQEGSSGGSGNMQEHTRAQAAAHWGGSGQLPRPGNHTKWPAQGQHYPILSRLPARPHHLLRNWRVVTQHSIFSWILKTY